MKFKNLFFYIQILICSFAALEKLRNHSYVYLMHYCNDLFEIPTEMIYNCLMLLSILNLVLILQWVNFDLARKYNIFFTK